MANVLKFTLNQLKSIYQTTHMVYTQVQTTFGNEEGFIDDEFLEFLNEHPSKKEEIIKALEESKKPEVRIDISDDKLIFLE